MRTPDKKQGPCKVTYDARHIIVSSQRGLQLIMTGSISNTPYLTVELYVKWYALYLVYPCGVITLVDYPENEYVDHIPNPLAVRKMADDNGWEIDELAWELMVGRWYHEVKGIYDE